MDGGLADIEAKVAPERQTPLTPPGSLSFQNLSTRCTGCQLCVSECPNQVLRPSSDLMHLMQPTMSYEHGYCRPECTRCSEVCPAGAIIKVDKAEKSSVQIGHAPWYQPSTSLPVSVVAPVSMCVRRVRSRLSTLRDMKCINIYNKEDTSWKRRIFRAARF